MSIETATPTQDERVMAALAHISAFLPTIGIIAPIVIWVTQKDKSQYVYFQALQAIVYHLCMIVAWFLGMACYMLSFFGNFIWIPFADSGTTLSPWAAAGFMIPFAVFGLIFLGWFVFIGYAVVATIMVFQGKNFRSLLIGRFIERSRQK